MSGALAATIIAGVGAAAAVGSTAYAIKAGGDQQDAQQQSLKQQNTAQQKAESASLSNQRKSQVAQGAVNQKTPDVASILARAATAGNAGQSSTMLTGPGGIDPSGLNLGKGSTLLGG
jgi:hypothetical protein